MKKTLKNDTDKVAKTTKKQQNTSNTKIEKSTFDYSAEMELQQVREKELFERLYNSEVEHWGLFDDLGFITFHKKVHTITMGKIGAIYDVPNFKSYKGFEILFFAFWTKAQEDERTNGGAIYKFSDVVQFLADKLTIEGNQPTYLVSEGFDFCLCNFSNAQKARLFVRKTSKKPATYHVIGKEAKDYVCLKDWSIMHDLQ